MIKMVFIMTWMTKEQFFAWIEQPKCSHCDKKATYFPTEKGMPKIYYCDDHYPYKKEKQSDENRTD